MTDIEARIEAAKHEGRREVIEKLESRMGRILIGTQYYKTINEFDWQALKEE